MDRRAEVLYADERLAVLAKPAGVSLATRRREPGAAVERLLAEVAPGEAASLGLVPGDLALVHRLDVGTSGVVVLARDADAHRALVRAFSERRVEKLYLALVWGRPRPAQGRWEWPLAPDRRDRRRMGVSPGGRSALTDYRVEGHAPHVSLVRLAPKTGRTHQIRVHLAYAGHPIVGDDLYAGPRHHAVGDPALRRLLEPERPLLHAWRIHLPETAATRELIVTAPLPRDFAAALDALGLAAVS